MFFESSKPVTGPEFFNRTEELKELLRSVEILRKGSTYYPALLGWRKLGKTLKSWIDRAGDLITASGGIYQIADPCLRLYLAAKSQIRAILPALVLGDKGIRYQSGKGYWMNYD